MSLLKTFEEIRKFRDKAFQLFKEEIRKSTIYISNKFEANQEEREELFQEANLITLKIIQTSKMDNLETEKEIKKYINTVIKNRLKTYLKKIRDRKICSIEQENELCDKQNTFEMIEIEACIDALIIDGRNKNIFRDYLKIKGKTKNTSKELAKKYNLKARTISNIICDIKKRLKPVINPT